MTGQIQVLRRVVAQEYLKYGGEAEDIKVAGDVDQLVGACLIHRKPWV